MAPSEVRPHVGVRAAVSGQGDGRLCLDNGMLTGPSMGRGRVIVQRRRSGPKSKKGFPSSDATTLLIGDNPVTRVSRCCRPPLSAQRKTRSLGNSVTDPINSKRAIRRRQSPIPSGVVRQFAQRQRQLSGCPGIKVDGRAGTDGVAATDGAVVHLFADHARQSAQRKFPWSSKSWDLTKALIRPRKLSEKR